jgi:2-iminobutanoate/2-iminopropanoate deaminase
VDDQSPTGFVSPSLAEPLQGRERVDAEHQLRPNCPNKTARIVSEFHTLPTAPTKQGEEVAKTNIRPNTVANVAGRYVPGKASAGGRVVYVSGQLGETPNGLREAAGDAEAETRQIFANIEAILIEAGGTLRDIVKLGIYLTDITDRAAVGKVRAELFPDDEHLPTSTMVEIGALVYPEFKVEIDAIAVIDD